MRISDWSQTCALPILSGQQLVPDLQGRLESNGCATLDERDGCNVGGFATLICFCDDILLLLGLVDLRDHGIEGIGEVRRRSGRRHAGRCRRLRLAPGAASRDHRSEEHPAELQSLMRISYP